MSRLSRFVTRINKIAMNKKICTFTLNYFICYLDHSEHVSGRRRLVLVSGTTHYFKLLSHGIPQVGSSFFFQLRCESFTNMFGCAFFRCAAASFQEHIRWGWQREVFWEWSKDESWEDCKIWKGRTWLKDVCVDTSTCKQPTYNITKAHPQLTRNLIRPDYPGFGF